MNNARFPSTTTGIRMAFSFSARHLEEYGRDGATVFRQILPPSLIADLRRACAVGVAHVRAGGDPQQQRFDPAAIPGIDPRPFADYRELPDLVDAISRLLSPDHVVDAPSVLINPEQMPWCTYWHRDWRDNMPGLDIPAWELVQDDADFFNQINCALYEDGCTWIVPGSHARRDTRSETDRFPTRPIAPPDLTGATPEEAERIALNYCESMPGAVRLHLDAGDLAVYRSIQWHIGNYVHYRPRATLHGQVMTPRYRAWWDSPAKWLAPAVG
jgi:hypothetical protein